MPPPPLLSLSLSLPGRPQNTRRLIAGELPLRRVSLEPRIPREPGESKEPGDPIAFSASHKSVLRNSSSSSSSSMSWGFPWEVFRSAVTSDIGTHLLTLTKGGKKVAMVGSGSSLRAGFARFFSRGRQAGRQAVARIEQPVARPHRDINFLVT